MSFETVYQNGLDDERRVIDALRVRFPEKEIRPSSRKDNVENDIDCWVNGKAVSIKAQHAGAAFRNIGMELYQLPKEIKHNGLFDSLDELEEAGWVPSWYYTGKVDVYAILQGSILHLYDKAKLRDYVRKFGFLRYRSLTPDRRQYLAESEYRYSNAVCGYLDTNCIPHYQLPMSGTKEDVYPSTHRVLTRPLQLTTL